MTMPSILPIILVVADQPLLRLVAVDLAEQAGFVTLTAADVPDAMTLLDGRDDVGAVLADLDRADAARGAELAAAIMERWPWIRVLVLTDCIDRAANGHVPTIIRPCADRTIVTALRAINGSVSAGSGR